MSPFDFINAINLSKKDLFAEDPDAAKEYRKSRFLINRGLSYFSDTVLYANEMNIRSNIAEDWQFFYFLNRIPKKKRYSAWNKKSKIESLDIVKEFYKYSDQKAADALKVLSEEQLNIIKEKLFKGGK